MLQRRPPHLSRIAHFFAAAEQPRRAHRILALTQPSRPVSPLFRERQTARPRDANPPKRRSAFSRSVTRWAAPTRIWTASRGSATGSPSPLWTRDTEEAETVYERPGHHTLSCYLDGGYRTERQKMPGALRRAVAALRVARRSRIALVGARPHAFHASVLPARTLHAARRSGTRSRAARTDARRSHLFRRRPHRQPVSVARQRRLARRPTACCAPTKPRIRC